MLQLALVDRLSLDPFSLQQDCLAVPEIGIGGRELAVAFLIKAMIVVADEVVGLHFKIAG